MQLPSAPCEVSRSLRESEERIPYKLLDGVPLTEMDQRLYRVISSVIKQALSGAELTEHQIERMSIFVGSSSFDVSISEIEYQKDLAAGIEPLAFRLHSFGNLAAYVRDELGIRGEDYSFSTACTASANALLTAGEMVASGEIDHALVLGVEMFNDTTALGFSGLGLLTRTEMTPFDKRRDGLILGEGCAAVIVGREKPKDQAYFLAGGASICDTYNVSSSNPDGSTVADVMIKAIERSGFSLNEVSAVKAHGTASLANDEAEAAGLIRVFSDRMPKVCCIKPYVGHTLGACGLVELVLFWRALESGYLIANRGVGVDGGLGVHLNQSLQHSPQGAYLLNYFGFGGNNCSLVIAADTGAG